MLTHEIKQIVFRIHSDCFHAWKIIPLYHLNKIVCPSFKLYSNLSFNKSSLKKLLPFYRHMLISQNQGLLRLPETSFQILSLFLWFNKYSEAKGTAIHFPKFSNILTFYCSFFENGKIKSWVNLKDRYVLTNDILFQQAQLKHAIPARLKKN